ncbi:hypothetical protein PSW56_23415, partial [Shigella flexneri]|nr:hypothetical protein [Shigella flexneri]
WIPSILVLARIDVIPINTLPDLSLLSIDVDYIDPGQYQDRCNPHQYSAGINPAEDVNALPDLSLLSIDVIHINTQQG